MAEKKISVIVDAKDKASPVLNKVGRDIKDITNKHVVPISADTKNAIKELSQLKKQIKLSDEDTVVKIKADVQSIMDDLTAQMSNFKDQELSIQAKVDNEALQAELNKIAAMAEKKAPKVKIDVKGKEEIDVLSHSLKGLANKHVIQVSANAKAAMQEISLIENKIRSAENIEVITTIKADISNALQGLEKTKQAAKGTAAEVKVTADVEYAKREIQKLVDMANKQEIKIKTNQSSNSGMLGAGLIGGMAANAIQMAINGVKAALDGATEAFIGYNAQIEQVTIAFESMLGSAEAAKDMMNDLKTMAASTPFEFKDLAPAAQQLKAFGFEAEDIVPTLTAIGNASAGLGKGTEGLKQMSLVFGQIKATGKLMGQDVMQLQNLGVPVKEILAKKLNLSADEVANIGSLGIDSDTAIDAIMGGMEERFPDMMKKMANTWSGMMSTIRDDSAQILGKIGEPIFNSCKEALGKVRDTFDTMLKNINKKGFAHIFDGLVSEETAENLRQLMGMFSEFWESSKENISIIGDALGDLFDVMGDEFADAFDLIMPLLKGLFTYWTNGARIVAGVLADLIRVLATVKRWVLDLSKAVRKYAVEAFNYVKDKLSEFFKSVKKTISELKKDWSNAFSKMGNAAIEAINRLLDKMGWVGKAIRKVYQAISEGASWVKEQMAGAFDFLSQSETAKAIAGVKVITGQYETKQEEKEDPNKKRKGDGDSNEESQSGGASGAVGSAKNDIERAANDLADIIEGLNGKIISKTKTAFQVAQYELGETLKKMREKAKSFADLGLDTTDLNNKIAEFEKISNEEIARKRQEANTELVNDTRMTMAKVLNDKRQMAQISYEIGMQKLEKERETKFKELALTMEDAEAKLAVERNYLAKKAMLDKQLAESIRKAPQTFNEAWNATLDDAAEKLNDKGQQLKSMSDSIFNSITDTMRNVFTAGLTGNFKSITSAFKNMLNQILSAIAKFLANQVITKFLSTLGGKNSGIGDIAGAAVFGGAVPARATGGPVQYGGAYLVGENGPEIFRPHQAGHISNQLPVGAAQPNVRVIVNNNTGSNFEAQSDTKFNGSEWVTTVVIDAISRNKNGMRDVIKGAV